MRFGDERESSNFEDVTGRSGGGFGFGGGGGNALGCLLPMVASRFGIGGVIVLVIG
jgi:predicted metalloprotease